MYATLLPGSALASWSYLQDTKSSQLDLFATDPEIARENSAFRQNLVNMSSVDDLMGNYQALKVALGAHGLQDDISNLYFVQKVIEEGVSSSGSFANQLSDSRYAALAATFETLGLTGSGDISGAVPNADLAAAMDARFGDSPLYASAAARLSSQIDLGLLGSDTDEKAWTRAFADDGLAPILIKSLGLSGNVNGLSSEGQVDTLQNATEYLFGASGLGTLTDPDNVYAIADTYLGTSGMSLDAGFSYGGLMERFDGIIGTYNTSTVTPVGSETAEEAVEAARWSALQQDTALRDILASVVGVSSGFDSLSAEDQVAELQSQTEAYFGRSAFELFGLQANVTEIGDAYLDPTGAEPLTNVFTLRAFTAQIDVAREADVGADDRWASVLSIGSMGQNFVDAYGLDAALLDGDQADFIAALKDETLARFGSDDVRVFEDADKMAALTGLYMDKQINDITDNYVEQEFRVAVGEQSFALRIALSLSEALDEAVTTGGTEDGQWYRVLSSEVLREAFQTAFGLGGDLSSADLDAQVAVMKRASEQLIGDSSVAAYQDPENQQALIERYLSQSAAVTSATSGTSLSLFTEGSAGSILATLYSG